MSQGQRPPDGPGQDDGSHGAPRVRILYCPRCRWLPRAAWMAQELLVTFERDLGEVALRPGARGVFDVLLGDDVIWSRASEGRFPELKELKQRIRDRIAPERALGHSDGHRRVDAPDDGQKM